MSSWMTPWMEQHLIRVITHDVLTYRRQIKNLKISHDQGLLEDRVYHSLRWELHLRMKQQVGQAVDAFLDEFVPRDSTRFYGDGG